MFFASCVLEQQLSENESGSERQRFDRREVWSEWCWSAVKGKGREEVCHSISLAFEAIVVVSAHAEDRVVVFHGFGSPVICLRLSTDSLPHPQSEEVQRVRCQQQIFFEDNHMFCPAI
eukprot:768432-Hanusia_phi.AAC.11